MPEISLLVTRPEMAYVEQGRQNEWQIAMRHASPDIAADLMLLTKTNRREVILGGCIGLIAADPGAIWRAHNENRTDDFDALFGLLARRPDEAMRFLCRLGN